MSEQHPAKCASAAQSDVADAADSGRLSGRECSRESDQGYIKMRCCPKGLVQTGIFCRIRLILYVKNIGSLCSKLSEAIDVTFAAFAGVPQDLESRI